MSVLEPMIELGRGLWTTMKQVLFNPVVTVQYPEE